MSDEGPDKREELEGTMLTDVLSTGINAAILSNPALLLAGIIPLVVDGIKWSSSQKSIK